MNLSKEAQAKIDAIMPKMKFVNCVAAIAREAMYYKDYDWFRQTLSAMPQPEQQKLADEWEAKRFTSSKAFLKWLREQPYFLEVRHDQEEYELFRDFAEFVEKHNGVLNNQLSDVPYSVGIFGIGDKLFVLHYQEDAEECWREEYDKAKAKSKSNKNY